MGKERRLFRPVGPQKARSRTVHSLCLPTTDEAPTLHGSLVVLLTVLAVIKLLVFLIALVAARITELDRVSYLSNYHHLRAISRFAGGAGGVSELFAAADAQWYAWIAERGYPSARDFLSAECTSRPKLIDQCQNYLSWAFFPLWPIVIHLLRPLLANSFAAGLIAANIFDLCAAIVLFTYLKNGYGKRTAVITVVLLHASPFAVFLDAPYTESLFLFLVSSVFLATQRRAWSLAGLCLGLAAVARPNGVFVTIVPLSQLAHEALRERQFTGRDVLAWIGLGLGLVPYAGWMLFNRIKTGDPFFFFRVQRFWFAGAAGLENALHNLGAVFRLGELRWHDFHSSRIDVIVMIISIFLLLSGIRSLRASETAYAVTMLLVPLVAKDLMSYSRFALLAWPLFLSLALALRGRARNWLLGAILAAFLVGQLTLTVRFVNWQWIG
jgi:hypothetical protein